MNFYEDRMTFDLTLQDHWHTHIHTANDELQH